MSVIMGTTNWGSPYTATVTSGTNSDPILGHLQGTTFNTFCVEETEYFYPGNTYRVALSSSIYGNGNGTYKPLDISIAWLYSNYLDSTSVVTGYNANEIQDVIWALEGDKTPSNLSSHENALYTYSKNTSNQWGSDFHGVQVMNLIGGTGDFPNAQSQLIRAINPTPVPVPGAALLGALGFAAIGSIRKRLGL
jgi:hypothetical protein